MKLLKDAVFKTDFTEEYFQNEIEKFINELKRINEPNELKFKSEIYLTKKPFYYESKNYVGDFKSFKIFENENLKGSLECFKSNNNEFFVIYCA